MRTLDLPEALEAAGVLVKILPNWDSIHKNGTYKWRESPEDPAGAMWHHTATASYTPNRDKASGYLGMGDPSEANPRLHQVGGSGRVPIYTLANAHPAPISSGYGVEAVLDNFVKLDVPFVGRQTMPDSSTWAGNTHYWNTEVVLDGIGSEMPQEMWQTLILVGQVMNDVFGWTSARHIGHGQHTGRKIDLRDGRFDDMADTIDALRLAIDDDEIWVPPPVEPPTEPPTEPTDPPPTGDGYMFPTIREGDGYISGPHSEWRGAVVAMQAQLSYHGFADEETAGGACAADGAFGSGSTAALKSFQKSKSLTQDGICGPKSWGQLIDKK